tara:strand:- start:363 stop:503 length:141 start_codon:yes stop_codon:yes gene_type:complete
MATSMDTRASTVAFTSDESISLLPHPTTVKKAVVMKKVTGNNLIVI